MAAASLIAGDRWRRRRVRTEALEAICVEQAKAGDLSAAQATAQMIENPYRRNDAEVEIALTRAQLGDLEGGLKLARSLSNKLGQSLALAKIAQILP